MKPRVDLQRRSVPMPAAAGIGLRAQHHAAVLDERPSVGWFEAHSENYFAAGGAAIDSLERIRALYPLSLHGVGLSLGSTDPIDARHLANLRRIVQRFEPALVSEHLCFASAGGRHANDLLPIPYTDEALRHVCERIDAVQEALGRPILIENVSSYLQFQCSTISEWEFLAAVAAVSGCGILLDINNIYVAACNHRFDARRYLQTIPRDAVQEMHLAGHSEMAVGGRTLLIDTHSAPVADAVWDLYREALVRFDGAPTLIEWDQEIPPLAALVAEAVKADAIRARPRADAA